MNKGKLITWKDDRGFGFIKPNSGGKDLFLHISELKDSTHRPQVGDTICYYPITENGKLRACNAFILEARSLPFSSSVSLNKRGKSSTANKSFPSLEMLLLSTLPVIGSLHFAWMTNNFIPLLLYPVMSLLTFALYAEDKSRAKRGDWRISEKMLHLCELAGGWWGGFIAQRRLRHKNLKNSYQIVFWAIVTFHLIFWVDWLFLGGTIVEIFLDRNFQR